mgnify:CR=1 FL=1
MGAQTNQSLAATRDFLSSAGGDAMALAHGLFAAALGLSSSPPLRAQLSDSSIDIALRSRLADRAFASLSTDVRGVIASTVALRWSRAEDLQMALEDMGIRSAAASAGSSDVIGELLAVSSLIHGNADVELGLGSKRAAPAARAQLVTSLVGGRVSEQTLAIVAHLVADPRGRRIGAMLDHAAKVVADQAGKGLAVVDVAKPLNAAQKSSIEALLVSRFGRPHYIAEQVNPEVVGGARIRVGDTIIDGSIAHRLQDLRGKLAG